MSVRILVIFFVVSVLNINIALATNFNPQCASPNLHVLPEDLLGQVKFGACCPRSDFFNQKSAKISKEPPSSTYMCYGGIASLQCPSEYSLNTTSSFPPSCYKYLAVGINLTTPTCPPGLYLNRSYTACTGYVQFSCPPGYVVGAGQYAQYCLKGSNPNVYKERGTIICPPDSKNSGNMCLKEVPPTCPAPYSVNSYDKACKHVVPATCPAGSIMSNMPGSGPICVKLVTPICPAEYSLKPDGSDCIPK